MNIQIFNIIQLVQLVQVCCQGKSEIAEAYTKQFILPFAVCAATIIQARDFWPVKVALLKYVYDAFMDTADASFLQPPKGDDSFAADDANGGEEAEESEVTILLKIVENLNEDFEAYLNDEIVDHTLHLPTGKTRSMLEVAEEYIFDVAIDFMLRTMQRKPTDIGSFDMKFFDIGKNIASLYYKASRSSHKYKIFNLLSFMQTSENCSRYLSDVKHPARKLKNNDELEKLKFDLQQEEEAQRAASGGRDSRLDHGSSKSSDCTNSGNEICNSLAIQQKMETEFEEMVVWVTEAEKKIGQLMRQDSLQSQPNPYTNVRFAPIISALLYLLDS